jgi:hypothetical protein
VPGSGKKVNLVAARNFMLEIISLKSPPANAMQSDVQSRMGGLAVTIAGTGLSDGPEHTAAPQTRWKMQPFAGTLRTKQRA